MVERQGFHGYRRLAGVVNRIAFILAFAMLLLGGEGLVSALFFGHQAHLPEAWTYSIVVRALALIFSLLLPFVRALRERYPRLLAAGVLSALATLFLNVAILFPSAWLDRITVTYYLVFASAGLTNAVALLKGERLDEFLLGLPFVLWAALFEVDLGRTQR